MRLYIVWLWIGTVLCISMNVIHLHGQVSQPDDREMVAPPPKTQSPLESLPTPSLAARSGTSATTPVGQAFTALHTCQLHNESVTIPTAPHFLIIGAQKAGTSSLHDWLLQHPQVQPGRFAKKKEMHFFHGIFAGLQAEYSVNTYNDSEEEFYCRARQKYATVLFQADNLTQGMDAHGRNPVVTFDKTPAYIHVKDCANHVSKTLPWGAKIVVILRNPTERAYSQHQMDLKQQPNNKKFPSSFEERIRREVDRMQQAGLNRMPVLPQAPTLRDIQALEFPSLTATPKEEEEAFYALQALPLLKKGMYAMQLRQWFETIPAENLKIFYYEDLKRNPDDVYHQMQAYLGLSNHTLPTYSKMKAGSYSVMNETTRLYLQRFFEPYNRQLEQLLGNKRIYSLWGDLSGT